MATTTAILARGGRLGGYQIDDLIAVGGMAMVYRAQQLSLGRPIALKVLAPQLSQDESFRERFRREGQEIARLDHPNVVTIYDSGEADGLLYTAMRLVEGTTLAERMRGSGLSADETVSILGQIAGALDAAHAIGLIHSDVKPQNVLLDSRGHAYLADFGVSAANVSVLQLTAAGEFVGGAVHYCAPEQIRGEEPRVAADVYSLTAVLYECLTGEVPYPRDDEDDEMHAHLRDPPPKLPGLSSGIAELNRVIARGMAKQPRDRYARASELARDAAALVETMPASRRRARPAFPVDAGRDAVAVAPARHTADWSDSLEEGDWLSAALTAEAAAAVARASNGSPSARSAERDPQTAAAAIGERREAARRSARFPMLRATLTIAGGMAVVVGAAALLLSVLAPTASSSAVARSGPLAMLYRAPWRRSSSAGPGASALRDPILLRSSAATLAAGYLASSPSIAAGPPPPLERRFGAPATRRAVLVAGAPGMRYEWNIANGDRLIAQVLATSGADLSIVCAAPASAAGEMASCLALAARAKLAAGTHLLPPGTHAGTRAHQLSPRARTRTPAHLLSPPTHPRTTARLLAQRRHARTTAALAAALRPVLSARHAGGLSSISLPRRAAAARTLARADQRGAALFEAATVLSRDRRLTADVVSALRRESGAFSALAAASAADDRATYAAARSRVLSTSHGLSAAVAGLAKAGFSLTAVDAAIVPAAPPLPKPKPKHEPARRTHGGTRRHVLVGTGKAHTPSTQTAANPATTPVDTTPVSTAPAETTPVVTTPAQTTATSTTPAQTTPTTTTPTTKTPTTTPPTTTPPPVATPPPHKPAHHSGGQIISGSGSV